MQDVIYWGGLLVLSAFNAAWFGFLLMAVTRWIPENGWQIKLYAGALLVFSFFFTKDLLDHPSDGDCQDYGRVEVCG